MKAPEFFVIGAMKSGTTTLFQDLASQPGVYLPEKEVNFFSDPRSENPASIHRYLRAFRQARPGQVRGECSTTYAMLPNFEGVARRAAAALGKNIKIIYLVREPVSRALSHHFHMYSRRGQDRMPADVNQCVRSHPCLIDWGCYHRQLGPWRSEFGDDAIHVIVFEEFIRDRASTLLKLADVLGFQPHVDLIAEEEVYNRGDGKPVLTRFWSRVRETSTYQRVIRPLLPAAWRGRLNRGLLPAAPPRPAPPSLETVDYIISMVRDDAEQLARWMGRDVPPWDFAKTREKHAALHLTHNTFRAEQTECPGGRV